MHLVWDQGVAGSNPVFPTILYIEKANNDYGQLFPNMTKRYQPFSELMKGRLFAVNALDENEVKDLFKKIFEL